MIFIINKTGEFTTMNVVKEENGTSLEVSISSESGSMSEKILYSEDPNIVAAFSKRFPSGSTTLNKTVNQHDFYIPSASAGMLLKEVLELNKDTMTEDDKALYDNANAQYLGSSPVKLVRVPGTSENPSTFQRRIPRNLILVISKGNNEAVAEVIIDRNVLCKTSVEIDGYVFTYLIIKWTIWSNLKYAAALKLTQGEEVTWYDLNVTSTDEKHFRNDLVPMSAEQIKAFEEEQTALAAKKLSNKFTNRPDSANDRKYNNNRNKGQVQNPANNGGYKKYNNENTNRGGNKKTGYNKRGR